MTFDEFKKTETPSAYDPNKIAQIYWDGGQESQQDIIDELVTELKNLRQTMVDRHGELP